MATFTFNDITYTAVFVDPSAGSNGDGTSVATPYNVLPSIATVAANTAVVVRRTVTPINLAAGSVNSNSYVMLVGAPLVSDPLYQLIPGASTWSGDASTTATINLSGSSISSGIALNGTSAYVENLTLAQTISGGGAANHATTSGIIGIGSANGTVRSCNIRVIGGVQYSDTSASYTYANRNGIYMYGDNSVVENCYIEVPNAGINLVTSSNGFNILNTTCKQWKSGFQCVTTSTGIGKIYGCNFYGKGGYVIASPTGIDIVYTNIYDDNLGGDHDTSLYNTSSLNIKCIGVSITARLRGTLNKYLSYCPSAVSIIFKDCTFTTMDDQSTGGIGYVNYGPSNGVSMYNCTFDCDSILNTQSNAVNVLSGCTFTRLIPCVSIPLYVPTVTQNKYSNTNSGNTITATNNSTLYIGTVSMSGAANGNRWFYLGNNGKIFIDNIDVSLGTGSAYSYLNFSNSETTAIYTKNEVVQGNWNARSLKTYMNSSNTYRSGSTKNYSIKTQSFTAPTNALQKPYLWIAPLPFDGMPVNVGTTGPKKLTVYFAYKLYDPAAPVNTSDIILEADVPMDASTSLLTTVSSKTSGIITPDSSTWVNDTGLTVKKLELYFNMKQVGVAKCRIGFFKYQASFTGGYIVIDPAVIVSDVS